MTVPIRARQRVAVLLAGSLLSTTAIQAVGAAPVAAHPRKPPGVVVCADRKPDVSIRDTGSRIVARGEAERCIGVAQRGFRVPVNVRIEKLVGVPGQRRWVNWSAWGGRASYGPTDMVVSIRREPGRFRARARVGRRGGFSQTAAINVRPANPKKGGGGW